MYLCTFGQSAGRIQTWRRTYPSARIRSRSRRFLAAAAALVVLAGLLLLDFITFSLQG
jgi:hypothetical protein